MLELIDLDDPRVIGLRVGAEVKAEEVEKAIGATEERLKDTDKVRLYCEIPDLESVSAKALQKEISYGLKNVDKFEKVAIVSDKAWLRALAELEDKLFPTMEEKAFKMKERKAAEEWVTS